MYDRWIGVYDLPNNHLFEFHGEAERVGIEGAEVPAPFRGVAIAMVTAGLMALAFMGFAGLDKYQ